MAFWSRLRSLLGLAARAPEPADPAVDSAAASTDATAADPGGEADRDAPSAQAPGLPGTIDDWNAASATGLITLTDGAELLFGGEACQQFTPFIGLRIEVLATGVPPASALAQADKDEPGLWATALRLSPGSQTEYAARLRISQVERAVRGQVERVINHDKADDAPQESLPPWARRKVGKKPAGPARPQDAFFALTVVLGQELVAQASVLSVMLHSSIWPKPTVRIIALSRKGQSEQGFSAEISAGNKRAFLLYRPQPYAGLDTAPQGAAHVGLFVGGPHSPRALALLPDGLKNGALPLSMEGEPRLISALARALLRHDVSAPGLVVNRAGKAWKPRDIALNQLGPDALDADAEPSGQAEPPLPVLLWIDWNVGEHHGARCQKSCGMESLGLPDVAVLFTADSEQDRARDALWFACHELAAGRLPQEAETLRVPTELKLQPGSRLLAHPGGEVAIYRIRSRDDQWLELEATTPPAA